MAPYKKWHCAFFKQILEVKKHWKSSLYIYSFLFHILLSVKAHMAFLSDFSDPLVNPNWRDSCWKIAFHCGINLYRLFGNCSEVIQLEHKT